MSSSIRLTKGIVILICAMMFLVLLCPGSLFASEGTVYVAGNPDLYPVEYYDSETEQYAGLMPELYRMLSEKTGYAFQYLYPGDTNEQERMAKNGQADIVSAYLEGEIDAQYLKMPQHISRITVDGEERDIYIAFSEIASEELIEKVSSALSQISGEQKLAILTSHAWEKGIHKTHILWIYILAGILFAFLIVTVVLMIYYLKKRKANRESVMIDPRYGIGNDQYYIYCFDSLLSDKSKSLYYLSYIAFDEETFNQQYGDKESKAVQGYVAEFLNHKTGSVEYLALVNEGVFAFLYQNRNKQEAEQRIETLINELNEYLAQFKIEYAGLFRAGVCVLEENMDCNSESAFYNAKQGYLYAVEHKLKYSFSTKNIVAETQQNERLRHRITQAIKDGEFQMYLQYIVDRRGMICGAEAVSRWQNPRDGLLSPSKYIEMMNQTGTVTMHDYYIFSQACAQLEKWEREGIDSLFLSCNFTRYSITSPDFSKELENIAGQYSFRRDHLILEVTENSLSHDPKHLQASIQRCKELGFLIALDDIGSGYTSLADLYNYPIDFVKVERDIVLSAMNARGKMLLDGLVRFIHGMDITVLCEGVETEEQNKMVLSTECDLIQGFYYSRVLPLKEAERYLKSHIVQ